MDLLLDEFEEDGELKRPDHIVFDVNLAAVVDTVKLGVYNPSSCYSCLSVVYPKFLEFIALGSVSGG